MSNIEYQTKSNIQIECPISNIQTQSNIQIRMSNIEYQTHIRHSNRMSNIEYHILNSTFKSNVEISNIKLDISHSNFECSNSSNIQTKSNIQIECRISNIKLNPTFKSNVEYQTQSNIQIECRISKIKLISRHSNRMLKIEYQTKSNIQIDSRISKIKLDISTFKF